MTAFLPGNPFKNKYRNNNKNKDKNYKCLLTTQDAENNPNETEYEESQSEQ